MAAPRTSAGGAGPRAAAAAVPAVAGWIGAGAALAATVSLLSVLLPPELVLLATGCVLATAGYGMAAAVWLAGHRGGSGGAAGWELASSLLFVGLAAVLLTDMGEALAVLTDREPR